MNVTHFGAKNYKDNLAKRIYVQIKELRLHLLILLTARLSGKFV